MKQILILVRHGESADKQQAQADFDRILTARGENSVRLLGAQLLQEKIIPKYIFSSAAKRAIQTTEAIAKVLQIPLDQIVFDDTFYTGTERDYTNRVHFSDDTIMLVGHNPTISSVIGELTGKYSIKN